MERDVLKTLKFGKGGPTTKVFLRQEPSQCFSTLGMARVLVGSRFFVGLITSLLCTCRNFMRASKVKSKVCQHSN